MTAAACIFPPHTPLLPVQRARQLSQVADTALWCKVVQRGAGDEKTERAFDLSVACRATGGVAW